jgi:hypothetical protein
VIPIAELHTVLINPVNHLIKGLEEACEASGVGVEEVRGWLITIRVRRAAYQGKNFEGEFFENVNNLAPSNSTNVITIIAGNGCRTILKKLESLEEVLPAQHRPFLTSPGAHHRHHPRRGRLPQQARLRGGYPRADQVRQIPLVKVTNKDWILQIRFVAGTGTRSYNI